MLPEDLGYHFGNLYQKSARSLHELYERCERRKVEFEVTFRSEYTNHMATLDHEVHTQELLSRRSILHKPHERTNAAHKIVDFLAFLIP